jgi:release factor glutamine methyltransferase
VRDATFNGLSFLIRPGHVMTPRPASEQLVAAVVEHVGSRSAHVVDVGTGTGAIAVAIATAAPNVRVSATDTNCHAVALARANVCRHGLLDRVTVYHGDLLTPVPGPIDVVVANLPYLPATDAARYPDLVAEPATAVFGSGDGLDAYRRLLSACAERLEDDGRVIIQLHRRVLSATRSEVPALRALLERWAYEPELAAA